MTEIKALKNGISEISMEIQFCCLSSKAQLLQKKIMLQYK